MNKVQKTDILSLAFNPLLPIHPIGQLISATTEEIVKAYYPSYFLLSVAGQIQTRQVQGSYDDSYLGEEVHLSQIVLLKLDVLLECTNPNSTATDMTNTTCTTNLASVIRLQQLYV